MTKEAARTILKAMQVDETSNIFSLSQRFRNATLYRQQVRACNLIWALVESQALSTGSRLAIIGGGAAGLTAAACALKAGVKAVTLLEQSETILPALKKSDRFVHPSVFDWPLVPRPGEYTKLVDLNWKADTANKIAEYMVDQWSRRLVECERSSQQVDVMLQVTDVALQTGRLSWKYSGKVKLREHFDVIILAVGIGVDDFAGDGRGGYWDLDNLEKYNSRIAKGDVIAIVGTGDGGVIDYLRAKIDDFNHERLFRDAISYMEPETLDALVRLEKAYDANIARKELMDEYRKLNYGALLGKVKLRDRTVRLVGEVFFSYQTSAINRYLLGCVQMLGGLDVIEGKADLDALKSGKLIVNNTPCNDVTHIVARVGINPPIFPKGIPQPRSNEILKFESELRPLYAPMWPDDWPSSNETDDWRVLDKKTITLVANISEPFGERLLVELYRCIDLANYRIEVVANDSEQGFERSLLQAVRLSPSYLVAVPPVSMSDCSQEVKDAIQRRDRLQYKTVFIENGFEDDSLRCTHTLALDHESCCSLVVKQMHAMLKGSLGRRFSVKEISVLILAGPAGSHSANARASAYETFLRNTGYSPERTSMERLIDWRAETAKEFYEKMLKEMDVPDVILCGNDSMALGVLSAMKEFPKRSQLKTPFVVGFDGTSEACSVIDAGCSSLRLTLKTGPSAYVKAINQIISDSERISMKLVISPADDDLYFRETR